MDDDAEPKVKKEVTFAPVSGVLVGFRRRLRPR